MKIETGKGLEDLLKIGEVLLSDMLLGNSQEGEKEEKNVSHMESLSKAYYESLKAPERDSEKDKKESEKTYKNRIKNGYPYSFKSELENKDNSPNLPLDKEKIVIGGKAKLGDWNGNETIVTGTLNGVTKEYGKNTEETCTTEDRSCNLADDGVWESIASHNPSKKDKDSLNKDIKALLLHLNFKEFSGTTVDGRYVSLNLEE